MLTPLLYSVRIVLTGRGDVGVPPDLTTLEEPWSDCANIGTLERGLKSVSQCDATMHKLREHDIATQAGSPGGIGDRPAWMSAGHSPSSLAHQAG